MRDLLERSDRPDGVFAFNDPVAIGAMRAILAAGLAIPNDIAVIGAANIRHGDMLRVPLSTIDQDTATIGRECGRLLLEAMSSPETPQPQRISVPIKLGARESSLRR